MISLLKSSSLFAVSPGSLTILNVIVIYKITEVERVFAFVFCMREIKYTYMLKCNLNTCVEIVEEPVINLEHYLDSSYVTLS